MEQSDTIQLSDQNVHPTDAVVMGVLGKVFDIYKELLSRFERDGLHHEWKYYKDGKAWLCKVTKGKKTIVWMSAWEGYFKATVYIQEKHIDEVMALALSETTKKNILDARNVGKLIPCTFKVKDNQIVDDLYEAIQYKIHST
ncbi:MAG: DUF3788 family protein [Sphaerochaetaceae bacterium]